MNLIPRDFGFDELFNDFFSEKKSRHDLKCDIYEKEGKYNFELDVPGFDKKDIKIECNNGYLTVSASKNEEHQDESKNYIRKERHSGTYQRSFYIGDIDLENINAKFDNNILKITVPIESEKETKKIINID